MSAKKSTPLDLEHNLFERSFGSKDLLHAHQPEYSLTDSSTGKNSLSQSANASKDSPSSLEHSSTSASSGVIEMKPKTSLGAARLNSTANEPKPVAPSTGRHSSISHDNNKHNLKLHNLQSVKTERLPGLTPPLFTPGGPRLPPIHPSPGIPLGSPGTPGSNMWSSLLNVTNGNTNTHEQYSAMGQNPYLNIARKASGLNPNESNTRSGLTPGGVNQSGFNFMLSNIPDDLGNGQITPGLQTLLDLSGTATANSGETHSQAPNGSVPQTINHPMSSHSGPSAYAANGPPPVINRLANVKHQGPKKEAVSPKVGDHVESKDALTKMKTDISKTQNKPKEKVKSGSKRPSAEDSENHKKAVKTNASAKATAVLKEEADTSENPRSPLNEEEKRRQFLERNRVAASKCRQRKKQLFSKMESELSYYSKGFRDVSAQAVQLREQLLTLRGILLNHKDCPGLADAAGGYQQLQHILAQADFVAQANNASESNYTSIPSTVPTTLNKGISPTKPMETQSRREMFPPNDANANQNSEREHNAMSSLGSRPMGGSMDGGLNVGPNGHMNNSMNGSINSSMNGGMSSMNGSMNGSINGSVNGSINDNAVMHSRMGGRVPFEHEMAVSRSEDNVTQDAFEGVRSVPNKENLRAINSASNLQNLKMNSLSSNVGLRPISSMADMQSQGLNQNSGAFS